jgi:hypothetical protein
MRFAMGTVYLMSEMFALPPPRRSLMTNFLQLVSSLREQMSATLSRSDALKPLAWLIGILATSTVLMLYVKAPEWMLAIMAFLLVASIFLYGFAYTFCLFKDRDALRSERYSLHKMAIEHGLLGDSSTGLFDPTTESQEPRLTPAAATKQIEKKR